MAAISSNTQWRHLSLFLSLFASNLVRSFPAYFGRIGLPSCHTVEHYVLPNPVFLIWSQGTPRLGCKLEREALSNSISNGKRLA